MQNYEAVCSENHDFSISKCDSIHDSVEIYT